MACVHQNDPQSRLGQDLEDREPIDSGGLHRHRIDATAFQPGGHALYILGKGGELLHRIYIPVWWHRYVVGLVTDINPGRVGMHDIEIQAPVWLLTLALLAVLALHRLILLNDLAASSPVAIGL